MILSHKNYSSTITINHNSFSIGRSVIFHFSLRIKSQENEQTHCVRLNLKTHWF